ncbi:hypothetical protein LRY60_05420 [Candidatus Woesebacteria bacterium]|nr:hypothetical protein [Candidatus Woesebacteria bacterium]MCD8507464.1 hypothetical protein [Candidatus Woesebacteria bacterium]MCD8545818.1 hypothetical protein [Candidatus Woesebacteria bacterium]
MPKLPSKKDNKAIEGEIISPSELNEISKLGKAISSQIIPDLKPIIFSPPNLNDSSLFKAIQTTSSISKALAPTVFTTEIPTNDLVNSLNLGISFYKKFGEVISNTMKKWTAMFDVVQQLQEKLAKIVEVITKPLIDPSFFRIVTPAIHIGQKYHEQDSYTALPHSTDNIDSSQRYLEERRRKENRLLDLQIAFYERQIGLSQGSKPGTVRMTQEVRPLSAVNLSNPTKMLQLNEPSQVVNWGKLSLNINTGLSTFGEHTHRYKLNGPQFKLLKLLIEKKGSEVKWGEFFAAIPKQLEDKNDFNEKREYIKQKIREIRRYYKINTQTNPESEVFLPTGDGYKLITPSHS